MKTLTITPTMRAALTAVDAAEQGYLPGYDSASVIELPKLALAEAVLDAVKAQAQRSTERAARLSTLPKARPVAVVEVTLRPKRRRA